MALTSRMAGDMSLRTSHHELRTLPQKPWEGFEESQGVTCDATEAVAERILLSEVRRATIFEGACTNPSFLTFWKAQADSP